MKYKSICRLLACTLALSAACQPASAASGITVPTGTIVKLGDNIAVASNAVSQSELDKLYEQSRENITSSSSDIDTNAGKVINKLFPGSGGGIGGSSGKDLEKLLPGGQQKKTLTYEEFMELIKEQGDKVGKKYEDARKEAAKEAKKGNEEEAKKIRDAVKQAMDGVDPNTGKPFDNGDGDGNGGVPANNTMYDGYDKVIDALEKMLEDYGKDSGGPGDGTSLDGEGATLGSGPVEALREKMDEGYDKYLAEGKQGFIQHTRVDPSEYENDELVYKDENHDITDIHYRCAACGELYGFDKKCACSRPKYLDNSTYEAARKNQPFGGFFWGQRFKNFNKNGESRNHAFISSAIECSLCKKPLTLDSLDFKSNKGDYGNKFYVNKRGLFICHDCMTTCWGSDHGAYGSDEFMRYINNEYNKDNEDGEGDNPEDGIAPEEVADALDAFTPAHDITSQMVRDTVNSDAATGILDEYYKFNHDNQVFYEDYSNYFINVVTPYYPEAGETSGELFESFISTLPEDQQDEARDTYAWYESASEDLKQRYEDEEFSIDAQTRKELEEYIQKLQKEKKAAEKKAKKKDGKNSGEKEKDKEKDGENDPLDGIDLSNSDTWTKEDVEKIKKEAEDTFDKGVPPEDYWDDDGPRIKDTDDFEDDANKVFKEWPADRSKWTDKQKQIYEDFCEKFGHSETLQGMVEEGVFDKDRPTPDVIKSIDDYIAGFTSISDSVTVVTTVDDGHVEDMGKVGSYDVKGQVRATVKNEKGGVVATRESMSGSALFWPALEVGRFTISREVDVYHVEWGFKKYTGTVTVTAVLPDGSTVELAKKEVTRIKEDESGMKQSSMKTLDAGSFLVNVVMGDLDINKLDYYDTERIR